MKLLVIGNGWSPEQSGGLNRYVTNLTKAIDKTGVQQAVLVLAPASIDPVPSLRVVASRSQGTLVRLGYFSWHIGRLAKSADVAVVHFALNALPIVLRRTRPPIVVHFHGPWSAESKAMNERRAIVYAKKRLEKLVYKRAARLVTLSEAFKEVLIRDYEIPASKILTVPPGVDFSGFHMTKCAGGSSSEQLRKKVICVRRLVPRMGIDILLRAWSLIADGRHDLVIVGEGPESDRLKELANHLGVKRSVTFAGHLPDFDLQTLYNDAYLSVVPTIELEGFGLVALESLASGTPVLASRTGGLSEFLGIFTPQLLVEPGNIVDLACTLQRALEGNLEVPTSEQCVEFASSYSWEALAETLTELYENVLSSSERGTVPE